MRVESSSSYLVCGFLGAVLLGAAPLQAQPLAPNREGGHARVATEPIDSAEIDSSTIVVQPGAIDDAAAREDALVDLPPPPAPFDNNGADGTGVNRAEDDNMHAVDAARPPAQLIPGFDAAMAGAPLPVAVRTIFLARGPIASALMNVTYHPGFAFMGFQRRRHANSGTAADEYRSTGLELQLEHRPTRSGQLRRERRRRREGPHRRWGGWQWTTNRRCDDPAGLDAGQQRESNDAGVRCFAG